MATEELDRGIRILCTNGVVDRSKCAAVDGWSCGVVAKHEEKVNRLGIADSLQKPRFLHKGCCLDDLCDVRVSGEVVQNPEAHNS